MRSLLICCLALLAGGTRADFTEQLKTFRQAGEVLSAAALPKGAISVGEVNYRINDAQIQTLDSSAAEGVIIGTTPHGTIATQISILHTFQPGPGIADWRAATGLAHRQLETPPDWPVVLRYEIEYLDGQKIEIPVRFGEGIESWYRVQTIAPMLWAPDHWAGTIKESTGEKVAVYSMQIPNPRPDQPVKTVRALPATETYRNYGAALILGMEFTNKPKTGKLYFVQQQPFGSDAQPGTFESPFGTAQKALDVAQPGDTIYVRGGYYALNAPLLKQFNGEKDKWLTISSFPGENPVFDARAVHYDNRVKPYAKSGDAAVGRVQHDTGAIHFWGDPDYSRIQGLHIQNSTRAAISVYGKAGPLSWGDTQFVDIRFNTTARSYSMGIISHGTDHLTVIGNRVIRPHALEMAFDVFTGEQVESQELPQEGIDLSRNRGFEVAFNTVTGGSKEAIDCISVEDGSVHHNYIDGCLNGIYIDSWTVPLCRVDVYKNFIVNAYSGIPLATEGGGDLVEIDIHHNIVIDSKSGGIAVTEATYKAKPATVKKHRVHNNTINQSGKHAIAIGWQASGIQISGFAENENFREVTVWNNIVTDTSGMPLKNSYHLTSNDHAIYFTNNLIWPANTDTTPEWMRTEAKSWKGSSFEPGLNTRVADPLYRDAARGDYRLAKGSPAIRAGKDGDDLGAIPFGEAWTPGLDFAGTVTSLYQGDTVWKPLSISRDLYTVHRNNLQRPSWFQNGRYGPDFRNLPSAEQSFGGTTFFIEPDDFNSQPNVLVLSGFSTESQAKSITGIEVNRTAAKLAFLHNVHIANPKNLKTNFLVFHYRVHYSNGTSVDIPIRNGQEIGSWNNTAIMAVPNAKTAFLQRIENRKGPDRYLLLYCYEWKNPNPELEIRSIDILRDVDSQDATPAVFAISTGI